MGNAQIIRGQVFENSAAVLVTRVLGANGQPVQQDDVSAIVCKSYDMTTGTLIASPSVDVADLIKNTLQTDALAYDSTGYNFAAQLSGDNWPAGDTSYRVEFLVTPDDGEPYYVVFELQCLKVLSASGA